ncbi:Hpt domain-containing protein [Shimia sp.]|uniref:Hpt domain-containing protein n=1 Tax=Shimia sp. TaxID=1954381 RepID=UPI003561315D
MIDWGRVADLREEIGAEDFDEIIDLFLSEVDDAIARLRAGPDPGTLGDDLHFLKGSALNLGFLAFADLCQQGESAAGRGAAETVDVAAILTCFDGSRTAFLDGVGARFPA